MKKTVIKALICILSSYYCINNQSIKAYYTNASYWSKGQNKLILLGDYHALPKGAGEEFLPKIYKQRKDVLDFVKNLKNPLVIIEDLDIYSLEILGKINTFIKNPVKHDPNVNHEFTLKNLLPKLNMIITPLIAFTQCCHACSIPVENVDFRYYQVESVKSKISTKQAHALLKKTLSEVEAYNDCKELNEFYSKTLSTINDKFKSHTKKDGTLVITHIPFEMSHIVIDLKLLHQIYQNADTKNIIVLAGANHIDRIEKQLEHIGYEKKAITRAKSGPYSVALDVENVLKRFCGKAHPATYGYSTRVC